MSKSQHHTKDRQIRRRRKKEKEHQGYIDARRLRRGKHKQDREGVRRALSLAIATNNGGDELYVEELEFEHKAYKKKERRLPRRLRRLVKDLAAAAHGQLNHRRSHARTR